MMPRSRVGLVAVAGLLVAAGPLVAGCRDSRQTARPAPTQAPEPGKITITTVPQGAAVIEGGDERLGKTPLTLTRPGFERVDLRLSSRATASTGPGRWSSRAARCPCT